LTPFLANKKRILAQLPVFVNYDYDVGEQRARDVIRVDVNGAAIALALFCISVVGCSKPNKSQLSFWSSRASSDEQVTPEFNDAARKLFKSIEDERHNVHEGDQNFQSLESAVKRKEDEVAKQISTRRDRDVYYLLHSYEGKIFLLHKSSTGAKGLVDQRALQQQVEACHDELVSCL